MNTEALAKVLTLAVLVLAINIAVLIALLVRVIS